MREGAGTREREMGFEEENRIRGREKDLRKGTGISGREQRLAETWRSRRHELGQGESADELSAHGYKKPALPSQPGFIRGCRGAALC